MNIQSKAAIFHKNIQIFIAGLNKLAIKLLLVKLKAN